MYNFNKSKDLPAFDIFEKLLQLVLNCKWEGDAIVCSDSEAIKTEHMPLLFAWPGILQIHLATITGKKEYSQQLNNLNKAFNDKIEYLQLRDLIDNLIKSKPFSKKKYQPPNLLSASFILLNTKKILVGPLSNYVRLRGSLGNFSILCCMISKLLGSTKEDAIITEKEIGDVFEKFITMNKLDIYWLSTYWMLNLCGDFDSKLDSFISSNTNRKGSIKFHKDSNKVPSIQRVIHKIENESLLTYAIMKKLDDSRINTDIDVNSCELAVNINQNKYFDYYLWQMRLKEELSDKNFKTIFLFLDPNGRGNDIFTNLVIRLYQVAKQSSLAMQAIRESWEGFIDDPAKTIELQLDDFDAWINLLFEKYDIRDEFFNFKALSRIVGNLDTDLDYEIIKEVRDEYKTAKHYHIPIELSQKLLKAKEELDLFVGLVIKNPDVFVEEDILMYFDEHRSKYSYMDLLEHDDIKRIVFSTEANALRENRRNILQIINKKLGGRDIKKSTLTKLLGLEPGEGKYLKYSR